MNFWHSECARPESAARTRGTLIARRASGENGEDLGFVGEIVTVDTRLIATLLTAGYLPVVAPLAVAPRADHAYNVNADLAAGAIAAALGARAFVLVTNVPRVLRDLDDPTSGIARLTADEAASFARSNACRSSMKPKLLAAANAVRDGAAASYICGAKRERDRLGAARRCYDRLAAVVVPVVVIIIIAVLVIVNRLVDWKLTKFHGLTSFLRAPRFRF